MCVRIRWSVTAHKMDLDLYTFLRHNRNSSILFFANWVPLDVSTFPYVNIKKVVYFNGFFAQLKSGISKTSHIMWTSDV